MKTLRIDDKWSVEYDPSNNDRPVQWLRYNESIGREVDNLHVAMFYALLRRQVDPGNLKLLGDVAHDLSNEARRAWCEDTELSRARATQLRERCIVVLDAFYRLKELKP